MIDIDELRQVFQMREPHKREPHHWLGIILLTGTILDIFCEGPPQHDLGCYYNRPPEVCRQCRAEAVENLSSAICATVIDIEGWALEDFLEKRICGGEDCIENCPKRIHPPLNNS